MWMMLPGIRKDQVSWQSLQCMLWAGSADPGVCVCGEGEHMGVLQLEQPSSLQDIPLALHRWKGHRKPSAGPRTDDENLLSSVPGLGSLQCPERKTVLCVGGTAFSEQDLVQWQLPKAVPVCLLQNLLRAPAQLCQPSCISIWCVLDFI